MNVSAFRLASRLVVLFTVLATMGLPDAARAATVPYRTDAELAAMSARIVRARVLGVRYEAAAPRPGGPQPGAAGGAIAGNPGGIYTVARLAVLEDLTGGSEAVIEVQELGGMIGGRAMVVPGTPRFVPGAELVLCLEPIRNGRWRTVAMAFSVFAVQPSGTDATLSRELAGVELVSPQAGPGRGAAVEDTGTRLLSRFRATVAAVKGVTPVAPAGAASLPLDPPAGAGASAGGPVSAPFTFLNNMRWMQADGGVPIPWYRDPSAPPPTQPGVNLDSTITRATAAWTNPPGASIVLTYGGIRSANVVTDRDYCGPANLDAGVIIFENPADDPMLSSGVLAIGGGCNNPQNTAVVNGRTFSAFTHGFVIFNNQSEISPAIQTDVNFTRVLTHEIGHGIGLDHTTQAGNLMLSTCCTSNQPVPPNLGPDDTAGVTFIYPAAVQTGDRDTDGLPDAWEEQFGLDPDDPNGVNGPTGDPDGDNVDNAHELTAGTHPRGFVQRYFAEGAVNSFFDTQFALVNYGTAPAHVLLRLQPQQDDGGSSAAAEQPLAITIPGQSRGTVTADMLRAKLTAAFATIIESDKPFVADRTMTWGNGNGAHAETAVLAPNMTWYFAEGATGPQFSLFYLLQNPHDVAVTARVRYLRGGGLPPLEKDYGLAPKSRKTIDVSGERFPGDNPQLPPPLSLAEVSGIVSVQTPGRPIIAERALYRTVPGQLFGAGHEGAGVPSAERDWFLAEGATGFFDQFILIANPNPSPVDVVVTYLLEGGGTYAKSYPVLAESRYTIQVNEERIDGFSFRQAAFSTRLSAPLPIIVERAMWWRSGTADWVEAHDAAGATEFGTRWALADGETGGARNTQTFILIANLGAAPTRLRLTYFLEPGSCNAGPGPCAPIVWETPVNDQVPANARRTVNPADLPALRGRRYSALIESLDGQPLVVERSMYSDAGGVFWAAGTAALGTRLPPTP